MMDESNQSLMRYLQHDDSAKMQLSDSQGSNPLEQRGNFMNIVTYINTVIDECAHPHITSKQRKRKLEELFHLLANPLPALIKVDLNIQFMSDYEEQLEMDTYFEGLARFYERNVGIAVDAIERTNELRAIASFSMIFTMLFYRVVLTVQPSVFSDVELLKMKLYLVKGANKLIEHETRQQAIQADI
ncbi:hypothetical protein FGO68_gene3890 [Halteria grandinella]|uniref:Uncharacterized protein n=1 Tax=Halteria grandinella TaxID=5974 RepID=A0A8J8NCJ1_HALGN|nr:hypothetical protein FGO68_gene3890 [Halteria grandinella]